MKTKLLLIFLLSFVTAPSALLGSQTQPDQQSWPQWRGPSRDGVFIGPNWPNSLSGEILKPLWRRPLDVGYSSPIVTADRVFTVETKDRKFEVVRAFDRTTGMQVWETQWDGAMSVPFFARSNGSWVRSTPVYDDGRLFVGGMRDVLVCLDATNGKTIWTVDFVKRNGSPLPSFGFASSPLVAGDHIYAQAGGAFVKLDKKTGNIVWKSMADGGGMDGSAFSSPFISEIQGRTQLIVQARTELAGVDPDSGTALWRQPIKAFRGMNILSPIVYNDRLLTSAYGGRTSLFQVDSDGEGMGLSLEWDNKLQGYMSTPVVRNGHAFLHLRNTRLACVNLENGEITWTTTERFGKYMSLVVQGDKILALDQKGKLVLFGANPSKFEKLDERKIADDETWAHLAVAGQELFIRELNAIAAFEWGKPESIPKSGLDE
jgi:outer membrane protein assembly factor BamB